MYAFIWSQLIPPSLCSLGLSKWNSLNSIVPFLSILIARLILFLMSGHDVRKICEGMRRVISYATLEADADMNAATE